MKLSFEYFPVAFLCLHVCWYLFLFLFWLPTFNLFCLSPPPYNLQRENTKQETDLFQIHKHCAGVYNTTNNIVTEECQLTPGPISIPEE